MNTPIIGLRNRAASWTTRIPGRALPVALLVAVLASTTIAQDRTNPRGVGMGRAINAAARGTDALGINPSLLALNDNRWLDIGLAPVGVHAHSDFISYDIYNDYFTGVPDASGNRVAKFLTEDDKNRLLSLLPDNAVTRADLDVMLFSIALENHVLGGIGFSVSDHVGVVTKVSRDYLRFTLFGLDSLGSDYNFSGNNFSGWYWREYNITYARQLPFSLPFAKDLSVGIGVKLLSGYGVFETTSYESRLSNTPDPSTGQPTIQATSSFVVRRSGADILLDKGKSQVTFAPEPAGRGTGFDIGVSGEMKYGIRVAAALVNVGSILWDKNLVETAGSGSVTISNPFTVSGTDSLEQSIVGKNRPGTSFSTPLPTKLRFGATMLSDDVPILRWLPGHLLVAVDYTQGLNASMGNTTQPRIALGTEYRLIPLIPLRTGIALGGGDSFRWAFGFGLNLYAFTLDIATENFGMLVSPGSFNTAQLSLAMHLKI